MTDNDDKIAEQQPDRHFTTVAQLIAKLQALPADAQAADIFATSGNSRTGAAYRVGEPFLTTEGDVVLSVGSAFIDDYEEVE